MYTKAFYNLPIIPTAYDVREHAEEVLGEVLKTPADSSDVVAVIGGLPRLNGEWRGQSSLVRELFARELMRQALVRGVELDILDVGDYRETPRQYSDMLHAVLALPEGHTRRAVRVVLGHEERSFGADRCATPQTYSYQAAAVTVTLVPEQKILVEVRDKK